MGLDRKDKPPQLVDHFICSRGLLSNYGIKADESLLHHILNHNIRQLAVQFVCRNILPPMSLKSVHHHSLELSFRE